MDHQRSSILPSNAPALHARSIHDPVIPSRVLQERCSNRQDDLSDSDALYRKGESSIAQTDNAFFYDIRHNPYNQLPKLTSAEIINESNRLWHRLLRCKHYAKYRSRQPKDAPPSHDLKWPEHMEIAFCRGMYPCRLLKL
jgi:hypothetical protein